jgi:hypothetical protein
VSEFEFVCFQPPVKSSTVGVLLPSFPEGAFEMPPQAASVITIASASAIVSNRFIFIPPK